MKYKIETQAVSTFICFIPIFFVPDWIPTGARNRKIRFDIGSTPLQIVTDSEVGSGDILWARFLPHWDSDIADGVGISVRFNDELTFSIGYCRTWNIPLAKIPQSDSNATTVWTFKKFDETLQLLRNGVEIVKYSLKGSSLDCRRRWSREFNRLQFASTDQATDTASDAFRPLTEGELC